MTQSEREKLELLLKKLKAVERPDISIMAQIHSIEELLKKK
jgi:hypothetical protein